jgi:ribonuclease-3
MLRLGRGAEQTGGRTTASILATTLEAVLGALYLDGGLEAVRAAVGRLAGWPRGA